MPFSEAAEMICDDKLRDPRWQEKRLRILDRDRFTCRQCDSKNRPLNVYPGYYDPGKDPWEYEDETLVTVCEVCHPRVQNLMADVHRLVACFGVYHLRALQQLLVAIHKSLDIDTQRWPKSVGLEKQQYADMRRELTEEIVDQLDRLCGARIRSCDPE